MTITPSQVELSQQCVNNLSSMPCSRWASILSQPVTAELEQKRTTSQNVDNIKTKDVVDNLDYDDYSMPSPH